MAAAQSDGLYQDIQTTRKKKTKVFFLNMKEYMHSLNTGILVFRRFWCPTHGQVGGSNKIFWLSSMERRKEVVVANLMTD